MKFRITAILSILICMLFCGCSSWMDGEYLSVTPHREQMHPSGSAPVEVSSYMQMRDVLSDLVESGADSCVMSLSSIDNATAYQYADAAVNDVMKKNPFASYAAEEISFEAGTNRGAAVIAFHVDYRFGRAEILQIRQTGSIDEAKTLISNALDNCENSVVLRVKRFNDADLEQFVEQYSNDHPDRVMEIPQVKFAVYPETGSDRIISLQFTYNTGRKELREMQEQVAAVFASAELYVTKTAQVKEIYSRLYSFLMERNDYTISTSVTPAYSLLYHGVGDSRAFANVYAAMCRKAGLDCRTITGTKDGIAWCWNVVGYRGKYYHVDLLGCQENGKFLMTSAQDMTGYVWDYSIYPQE